jgi:GT2 family glycosyltransferase
VTPKLADRPPVSVVVPFHGSHRDARRTVSSMALIEVADGDEVVLADNTAAGVLAELAGGAPTDLVGPAVRIVRAAAQRSSYHARNAGATAARNEWLLFVDADCVPAADLLDAYFADPIAGDCAILGGEIAPDTTQSSFLARYARSRNYLSQTEGLHGQTGSAVATANALVRRTAFDAVGGFAEDIRSGGDVDLCWRVLRAGWTLGYRPEAVVVHPHRERLVSLLGQIARYAAGARWLDDRHPGSASRWPLLPGLAGAARDVVSLVARRRLESAAFRMVDGLGLVAHNVGYLASNEARSE